MKLLTLLNPKFCGYTRPDSGELIEFDCPACPPEAKHRVAAYLKNPVDGKAPAAFLGKTAPDGTVHAVWIREGLEFSELTLEPSMVYPCWHGWVEAGKVYDIAEATHVLTQVVTDRAGNVVGQAGSTILSPRQTRMLLAGRLAVGVILNVVPEKPS